MNGCAATRPQNRRRNTAATWVIADADAVVGAYVSVPMTSIDRSAAPSSRSMRLIRLRLC